MHVLVACEESGIVRDAFIEAGHDAISVDLQSSRSPRGPHFQGDIRLFLERNVRRFDLAIAHPTCTRLTNSGVRWLAERTLWQEMREGAAFFNFMKQLPADRIAIENPVMHKYARELCGEWTQTVQPWQFGDPIFKRTGLWLINLPPLVDTNRLVPPRPGTAEHKAWSSVHRCPPGPERAKLRSTFFPGVAKAMAKQWGALT